MKPPKHPVAIACASVAVIALIVYLGGHLMASASGYPSPQDFSSAEVYLYDGAWEPRTERLSAREETLLRTALGAIHPHGWKLHQDEALVMIGGSDTMFALTLADGGTVRISTNNSFIRIDFIEPLSETGYWKASYDSLNSLSNLYISLVEARLGELN